MQFRHFKTIFPLLLMFSVSIVLFILSWGPLRFQVSQTFMSGKNKARGKNRLPDVSFWHKKGTLNPTPDGSATINIITSNATKASYMTDKITSRQGTVVSDGETPIPILFKKDFKKLPQWDFEDIYNQDVQPRQTTCARSVLKSGDQSFKQAYIPNIGLYLHKDNLNMSDWNRLSHFNNPFGFMEYQYDDVMAAVKLIPKPKEPLLPPKKEGDGCVSCAVVGTAGILNGSGMGEEIDAHDYVFRMNGALTKGFEDDVGNKTSVYVHTAHSITMSQYLFKSYGYKEVPHDQGIKYVMIPEGMRDFEWLQGLLTQQRVSRGSYRNMRPWTYYAGQFDENRFYVLHPDFLRYVRNRFLRSSNLNSTHWPIVRPTNGAFTVFLALHTCDIVDIYGFMTEDFKKYSNYYFQKHDKTNVIFYINHDYTLEMKTWLKLHNTKIVRLYQRKNSTDVTETL